MSGRSGQLCHWSPVWVDRFADPLCSPLGALSVDKGVAWLYVGFNRKNASIVGRHDQMSG